jgi:hypothetical protein
MLGWTLWVALAAAHAGAQAGSSAHTPDVEAHLAPLIGDWTRAGMESTYRDRCVWYERRAFVVCSLSDGRSGGRVEAIIGYSKEERRYTYQNYTSDGTSHTSYGYALGDNGLVFTEERKIGDMATRLTTSMVPQPDGRLRMVQQSSVMGQPWKEVGEVFYIKRK